MTVLPAAVVRWMVMMVVVVMAGTVQATSLVDLSRCRDSCSSVPEDLWPSCCEVHHTCCEEFANSCMHDCLPRVHTGDVSVVEERPGMCCALYNLCCFRETFRISSQSKIQGPVSFPIVHRFQVQPPTAEEASRIPGSRPAPRPSFRPTQQEQDTPKTQTLSRPQLSKKPFRPNNSDGFKKLPEGDNTDDSKKPRSRPKFSSLLNRNTAQTRVTRRPAGSDIRQEVIVPEVSVAESIGARRLDASINPVVTRKRLLVNVDSRRARVEERKQEPEPEVQGPRGRNLQNAPAREGRKLGGRRNPNRPASQQSNQAAASQQSSRSQPVVNVPEEKPKAAPAFVQPEPVVDSANPAAEEETDAIIDSVVQQVPDTPAASETSPETAPLAEESVAEKTNPSEVLAEEKAPETQSEPVEKAEAAETDVVEPVQAPENTAFSPPEIVVNTPEVPKEKTTTVEEPPQEREGGSRSTSSRGQAVGEEASRGQSRSRSTEQTQGRSRATSRGQTGERATSRTASQGAEREATNTARQSQVSERSRGSSRTRA